LSPLSFTDSNNSQIDISSKYERENNLSIDGEFFPHLLIEPFPHPSSLLHHCKTKNSIAQVAVIFKKKGDLYKMPILKRQKYDESSRVCCKSYLL